MRIEYNLKFIGCLVLAQFFLLGASYSLKITTATNLYQRVSGALVADVFIIILINILYFLLPVVEISIFKSNKFKYRKNAFAFINILNLFILAGTIILIFLLKA